MFSDFYLSFDKPELLLPVNECFRRLPIFNILLQANFTLENIFLVDKLIIFVVCSLKDLQFYYMRSSPLYASCLFSVLK